MVRVWFKSKGGSSSDRSRSADWCAYVKKEHTERSSASRETVREYMKRAGLDAWRTHFEQHLPANFKSVALLRATTSADLRRLGKKASMQLDNQTIQQVLNALKTPGLDKESDSSVSEATHSSNTDGCYVMVQLAR